MTGVAFAIIDYKVRRGMSCRFLTILALTGSFALASAASAQTVGEPPPPATAPTSPSGAAATAAPSLARFEVLASVGYGAATEIKSLETNPYAFSLGFDAGYTWDFGLRLGAELIYGFGRSIPQTFVYRRGEIELTAESSTLTAFVTVGYDLWLRFLILRYSLGMGLTHMEWDLGELEGTIGGYAAPSGSSNGFVFAPGLAVLWPYQLFEVGLGFDYLFQAATTNPSGFVGQLLLGVKL